MDKRMTVKEAQQEVRAITNNLNLEYSEHYSLTKEQIIDDLQEAVREFNEIIKGLENNG